MQSCLTESLSDNHFLNCHCFREIITLPDGGEVALDWTKNYSDDKNRTQPILLIIPGLTGEIEK